MLPDRVSNPGPLTYESGARLIALCGPAIWYRHVDYHLVYRWKMKFAMADYSARQSLWYS